jgi:hypothetical protein
MRITSIAFKRAGRKYLSAEGRQLILEGTVKLEGFF